MSCNDYVLVDDIDVLVIITMIMYGGSIDDVLGMIVY